jgi:hypothetical protein
MTGQMCGDVIEGRLILALLDKANCDLATLRRGAHIAVVHLIREIQPPEQLAQ